MENRPKRLTRFLKKMNRGVALCIALALIMTVYAIVDGAVFENRHKKDICELVGEYFVDVIKLNDAVTETEVGKPLTDKDRAAMKSSLEALVSKYYSTSKDAQKTYTQRTQNGMELIEKFNENGASVSAVIVESIEPQINLSYAMNVSRFAGKFVHVNVYAEYNLEYLTNNPDYLSFFGLDDYKYGGIIEYARAVAPDVGGEIPESKSEIYRVRATIQISGVVKLVRDGGEWRIACTESLSSYIRSSSYSPVKKEEVKANG